MALRDIANFFFRPDILIQERYPNAAWIGKKGLMFFLIFAMWAAISLLLPGFGFFIPLLSPLLLSASSAIVMGFFMLAQLTRLGGWGSGTQKPDALALSIRGAPDGYGILKDSGDGEHTVKAAAVQKPKEIKQDSKLVKTQDPKWQAAGRKEIENAIQGTDAEREARKSKKAEKLMQEYGRATDEQIEELGSRPDKLIEGLHLGDYQAWRAIGNTNFKTAVKVTNRIHNLKSDSHFYVKVPEGVSVCDIGQGVVDDAKDPQNWRKVKESLPRAFREIDSALDQGENVLVFCNEGESRSPSVVIAYLAYRFGISVDEANMFAQQQRPRVNTKFLENLKQDEEWLHTLEGAAPVQQKNQVSSVVIPSAHFGSKSSVSSRIADKDLVGDNGLGIRVYD